MSDSHDEPGKSDFPFRPVPLRARRDGWTPDRQRCFIEALAETACVEEACRHVGMTSRSAYTLRRRPEAIEFRAAWDAAMDHSVARLSDAALGRAIYGVPVPHFYKGEQVGEHRRYDERLTMWLLRYRDPGRYGKWRDREAGEQSLHSAAMRLGLALQRLVEMASGLVTRPLRERLFGLDAGPEDPEDGEDEER
jgi:hypothetical protein